MVISDKARFPGVIFKGREYPEERLTAGMLFFNDEGTENGGLIFSGHKNKDGKVVNSGGSLTFDKYEQDQLVQLLGADDSDGQSAGLIVSDRPDHSLEKNFLEEKAMPVAGRDELMQLRRKDGYYGSARITLTRGDDGIAKISLRDGQGHPRIVMGVAKDGSSSLKFLDADGNMLNQLTPTSKPPGPG